MKFSNSFFKNKRNRKKGDFLAGPMVKNAPCHTEDTGSIPGWEAKILRATQASTRESIHRNEGSHMMQ